MTASQDGHGLSMKEKAETMLGWLGVGGLLAGRNRLSTFPASVSFLDIAFSCRSQSTRRGREGPALQTFGQLRDHERAECYRCLGAAKREAQRVRMPPGPAGTSQLDSSWLPWHTNKPRDELLALHDSVAARSGGEADMWYL